MHGHTYLTQMQYKGAHIFKENHIWLNSLHGRYFIFCALRGKHGCPPHVTELLNNIDMKNTENFVLKMGCQQNLSLLKCMKKSICAIVYKF